MRCAHSAARFFSTVSFTKPFVLHVATFGHFLPSSRSILFPFPKASIAPASKYENRRVVIAASAAFKHLLVHARLFTTPSDKSGVDNSAESTSKLDAQGHHAEASVTRASALALHRRRLLHSLNESVSKLHAQSHHGDAEALLAHTRGLEYQFELLSNDHYLADAIMQTAQKFDRLGCHDEALDLKEQALAFARCHHPLFLPDLLPTIISTARSCDVMGLHDRALQLFHEGKLLARSAFPPDNPVLGSLLNDIGSCLASLGRHAEALDHHKQALVFFQGGQPSNNAIVAKLLMNIGRDYHILGKHTSALSHFEQSLAGFQRALPADDKDLADAKVVIANITTGIFKTHPNVQDVLIQEQALALIRRVIPNDQLILVRPIMVLMRTYDELDRGADASDLHEQLMALLRRALPANDLLVANCMFDLGVRFFWLSLDKMPPQAGWFIYEAESILCTRFSNFHTEMQRVSTFIGLCILKCGICDFRPSHPPSLEHLRIGRLVRLHDLPSHALNGSEALVFGPEQNGLVPVRLVEASDEVRAALDWAKGAERAISVENLRAIGLPPVPISTANLIFRALGSDAAQKLAGYSAILGFWMSIYFAVKCLCFD